MNDLKNDLTNSYTVTLKQTAQRRVASIRERIPAYSHVSDLLREIEAHLRQQGAKPRTWIVLWHDDGTIGHNVDAEAAIEWDGPETILSNDRIKIYDLLGAENVATVLHQGSYATIPRVYSFMRQWAEKNSYRLLYPRREIYWLGGADRENPIYVTEVQFPVELRGTNITPVEASSGVGHALQNSPSSGFKLVFGNLVIDPEQRSVTLADHALKITGKEFDLLVFFAKHPMVVLSRKRILDEVWGYGYADADRTVDTRVRYLRMKLEVEPSTPKMIVTVYGVGYKFVPPSWK
ncbi:MAG: winged helix-turn-helix domain-containing protein [Chloroflexota bacterium]|nr:winged helix-turn-helix domain-containing protein [Chloroflexota bacterium]MDQ5866763.1 winged helix-turn-helix domain-containing protein [Chloroflexota bacterium]